MLKLQSDMEPASKMIRRMNLPGDTISHEQVACSVWARAVGKKIASHSRAARLVRTRLVVEVEDKVWRTQLMSLSGHILHNLEKSLGRGAVQELEFRVVPPRLDPRRALAAAPGLDDEANGIADPVLRSIYRAARKKALA
jgi:hypothetical protein